MNGKLFWKTVSAAALAWAALWGCGQQGALQMESLFVKPAPSVQLKGAATAAPVQGATPPSIVTHVVAPLSQGSATVSVEIAALVTVSPAWKADSGTVSDAAVEKAKADLAKRLGVPVKEIAVITVIGQEYSPEAFYCRTSKGIISKEEPAEMIIGETILLEAQGIRYEYHAEAESVTFCRRLH